ncbi:hypothetical protein AVEN_117848-1 [Araneus ventricosus]|uniref:Uncharacterized protein n=1 Tax=Araneus ventricosus TaxID=182803 RepID=A0A4Y2VWM1_ARAVE|nr:hypothetical protein AVEN_117848-1 [Araneus ventricosus]
MSDFYPDRNFLFAASLHCKSAILTRQEGKLETSLQKRRSHHATNLQQACHVKLIANIGKTEYEKNLGLELATYCFQSGCFNHSARLTPRGEDRFR